MGCRAAKGVTGLAFPTAAQPGPAPLAARPAPVMYDSGEPSSIQPAGSFIQCLKNRWCMKCNLVLSQSSVPLGVSGHLIKTLLWEINILLIITVILRPKNY